MFVALPFWRPRESGDLLRFRITRPPLARGKHVVMCALVVGIFIISPVWAQGVPVPANKAETLGNLDKKLEQYKSEEKKLKKDAAAIKKELSSTKDKLVDVAKSIQENESALQVLEERIEILKGQQEVLNADLEEDRKSIAKLITALERIRRVPPEAMIARPDAPINTARSAMLMQDILPSIHRQSEALKVKLEELSFIDKDLAEKRSEMLERSNELREEQKSLEGLVADRQQLFEKTNSDLKGRQKKVADISAQAQNLSDLVKKLEQERTRAQEQAAQQAAKAKTATLTRHTPMPKAGGPQLPLQGILKVAYNEKDSFGAQSKGLTIEGRSGALIVAPMGGVIRFAGHFKSYGNMVILEHENGYHSLIAGLEKIDTVVDQSIEAGEPLGRLYSSENGKPPTLYYELRHNGKAVDPARTFGNLG